MVGYGENTPLGPNYLPAYAEGTRSGIKRMAPDLLGADPTKINHINYLMDKLLKGHPYVKSAIGREIVIVPSNNCLLNMTDY